MNLKKSNLRGPIESKSNVKLLLYNWNILATLVLDTPIIEKSNLKDDGTTGTYSYCLFFVSHLYAFD